MSNVEGQLIAIVCADDSVAVLNFVTREYLKDGSTRWARAADRDGIEAEVQRAALAFDAEKLPIKEWHRIDREDFPVDADRTYRNALRIDKSNGDPQLVTNMDAARAIHRDLLRGMRAPELAALDVAYMRALESGDDAAATSVVSQKDALRDITDDPSIDAAQTPEELKAILPTSLKG